MPILNVKISGDQNPQTTRQVSTLLLELTHSILGKKREVTAVAVDYVPASQWLVGGSFLSEQNKSSFYFDIKITEGTNTKDELAAYIKAAFAGMTQILGELHEESYIYVEEVRGFAYGYGGLTQEHRYIASRAV